MLEIVSKKYLRTHQKFLKNASIFNNKDRLPRFLLPRGGDKVFFEILAITIKMGVNFLAKKGLVAGFLTGTGLGLIKIPATAVSKY